MKTIEEKARAYDEAVLNGSRLWESGVITRENYEYIFPELKESEDERIRKEITEFFKNFSKTGTWNAIPNVAKWIEWLEKQGEQKPINFNNSDTIDHNLNDYCCKIYNALHKENGGILSIARLQHMAMDIYGWCEKYLQGEQKPTDKVESKFKIGNWYQCTKDFFGKGVTFDKNTAYYCAKEGCLQDEYGCHIAIVKDLYDNFKLWTIQDAKDGDVIYSRHNTESFEWIGIFKSLDKENKRVFFYGFWHNIAKSFSVGDEAYVLYDDFSPATKEQRDTLEKAMADAGYEFDFKKKELKKIIDEKQIKKNLQDSSFRRMFEQNWSEEDNIHLTNAILAAKKEWGIESCTSKWLKDLKDRVQPQNNWEPSEEHIHWLKWAINRMPDTEKANEAEAVLEDLLEQLKKL